MGEPSAGMEVQPVMPWAAGSIRHEARHAREGLVRVRDTAHGRVREDQKESHAQEHDDGLERVRVDDGQ